MLAQAHGGGGVVVVEGAHLLWGRPWSPEVGKRSSHLSSDVDCGTAGTLFDCSGFSFLICKMAPNSRGRMTAHCCPFQLWKARYFVHWHLHLPQLLEKRAGELSAHSADEKNGDSEMS